MPIIPLKALNAASISSALTSAAIDNVIDSDGDIRITDNFLSFIRTVQLSDGVTCLREFALCKLKSGVSEGELFECANKINGSLVLITVVALINGANNVLAMQRDLFVSTEGIDSSTIIRSHRSFLLAAQTVISREYVVSLLQ